MANNNSSDVIQDDEETVMFDAFKKFGNATGANGVRSGLTSVYNATIKAQPPVATFRKQCQISEESSEKRDDVDDEVSLWTQVKQLC